MATADGRIFISYRRQETAWPARQLYEALCERFGVSQVFKDVDNIAPGEDFVARIAAVVGSCQVLLAMIGPQWLQVADEDGNRRIDDPDDFVRLEIGTALGRGVLVVPILVDGARMPKTAELPPDLTGIARRQAVEINPTGFNLDRLFQALDAALSSATAAAATPAGAERVATVAERVEPVVKPAEPVEPPAERVEPAETMEPIAEPVEPVVEPVAEPIEPVVEPVAEPREPVVEPVEPVVEAVAVPVEPAEPVEVVGESVADPPIDPGPAADPTRRLREPVQPHPADGPPPVMVQPPRDPGTVPPVPPVPPLAAAGTGPVRSRLPLLVGGVAVLVVLAGLAAWLLLGNPPRTTADAPATTSPSPSPSPTATEPVAETVLVDRSEVATGVQCTPGRVFSLSASGELAVDGRTAGADGSAGWFDEAAPLPEVPLEALIGRVGEERFFVGDTLTLVCPAAGELELGTNSVGETGFTGSLTAEINSRDDLTADGLEVTSVVVPATQSWVDSGFECAAEESFRVSATGIASAENATASAAGGPDGVRPRDGELVTGAVLKTVAHRALLGRVDDGEPFLLGSSQTVDCPAAGVVELQVNDGVLEDNTGEFAVVLSRWPRG